MNLKDKQRIMLEAKQNGQAVPAYDTNCYTYMNWLAEAASAIQSPVIFMFLPNFKESMSFREFTAFKHILEVKYDIPMMTHLDHSRSLGEIQEAIDAGFDSVMIDASSQPFADNVRITREVVEYAHERGTLVEAELGKVGSGSRAEDFKDQSLYTNPEEAAAFVEQTGVDLLAVAVGNSHGVYVETPHLDQVRIRDLAKAVPVPLVLHGTSLIPDTQLLEAIAGGICKINLCTEMYLSAMSAVKKAVEEKKMETERLTFVDRAVKPEVMKYFSEKLALLRQAR